VFNVLLQVLDDGRMTDGQGRTVDFKNTVIVMTSNLGSQMIQQMAGDDYGVIKLAVMGEVKTYFRPEFINRIDEIVVFHALDEKNIAGIAKIQLGYLEKRLAKLDMGLEVSKTPRWPNWRGRLRPGVRRAAAEARDPGAHREPALLHPRHRPTFRRLPTGQRICGPFATASIAGRGPAKAPAAHSANSSRRGGVERTAAPGHRLFGGDPLVPGRRGECMERGPARCSAALFPACARLVASRIRQCAAHRAKAQAHQCQGCQRAVGPRIAPAAGDRRPRGAAGRDCRSGGLEWHHDV
jgi:hypothetical protein